jgi:hypothetical protein
MAYRAGELRVDDPEAGELRVTGDGYAAAGELVTWSSARTCSGSWGCRRRRWPRRRTSTGATGRPSGRSTRVARGARRPSTLPRCPRGRRSSARSDDCSGRSAPRGCAACRGGSGVVTRSWTRTWPTSLRLTAEQRRQGGHGGRGERGRVHPRAGRGRRGAGPRGAAQQRLLRVPGPRAGRRRGRLRTAPGAAHAGTAAAPHAARGGRGDDRRRPRPRRAARGVGRDEPGLPCLHTRCHIRRIRWPA